MSDETKCPKCGAEKDHSWPSGTDWRCGSGTYCGHYTFKQSDRYTFKQSDRCRITQLEQQLAVAVAALNHIVAASDCLEWNSPCDCPCCIAAEALRKIGAIE